MTAGLYEMELAEVGADPLVRSPTRHVLTECALRARVCSRFWGRYKKIKKIAAVTEPGLAKERAE